MSSRRVDLHGGYILIDTQSEAHSAVECDGVMLLTEQLSVQRHDINLMVMEPIQITAYHANWAPGGFNYQVKVQTRYVPDSGDKLHVWVAQDFMEVEKDRMYFSDVPESAIDIVKNAITPDAMLLGGYLTFCRFEIHPIGFYIQALKALIEGILELIQIDWVQTSDETIQSLFKRP